jgi:hypothetical protein
MIRGGPFPPSPNLKLAGRSKRFNPCPVQHRGSIKRTSTFLNSALSPAKNGRSFVPFVVMRTSYSGSLVCPSGLVRGRLRRGGLLAQVNVGVSNGHRTLPAVSAIKPVG